MVFGEQQSRETRGLMHANAAMAERAHSLAEQVALGRIVHVDGVLVGEVELELTEHIGGTGRLGERVFMNADLVPIHFVGIDWFPLEAHPNFMIPQERHVGLAEKGLRLL